MILFRKNVLLLPLQISVFDLGFGRLIPFFSNILGFKITKLHHYNYGTGDFYFDPKALEKVKSALFQEIDINLLKTLEAIYQKTERKLVDNTKGLEAAVKMHRLSPFFKNYLEFAKFPLLSKLLPELISLKIQEDQIIPPEIFLKLIRPMTTTTRRFCEKCLALGVDFSQNEGLFRLLIFEEYHKLIKTMKKYSHLHKRFNQFINDFYAFGPRRWDIEGCENPITALKMIRESCENLDKKALVGCLQEIKKEKISHHRFLKEHTKQLTETQNKFLEYLWFFQSALDNETLIQRLIFFRGLLPVLVNKGKDFKKRDLLKVEEDILFMHIEELFSQRFSMKELTKRKRNYFSLIKKLNDPGNINFFKRLIK